jgi:hypothetical protein
MPNSIRVSFDQGRASSEKQVRWIATNVFQTRTLTVRKGDALLLTAHPASGAPGPMVLEFSDTASSLRGSSEKPIPYTFERAGVHTIKAAYGERDEVRGVLTVKVVEAVLPRGLVAWVNRPRPVDAPGIGPEVMVDGGGDMTWTFTQTLLPAGRRFRVQSFVNQPAPVLARLGADGPVLDRSVVDSFDLANSHTRVVRDFPDGSLAVDHALTIGGSVLPDMEVRLELFVAGVLFEDGSRIRNLKAGDFDSSGTGVARMLLPKGVRTSVCHWTRVYQAGVCIGQL